MMTSGIHLSGANGVNVDFLSDSAPALDYQFDNEVVVEYDAPISSVPEDYTEEFYSWFLGNAQGYLVVQHTFSYDYPHGDGLVLVYERVNSYFRYIDSFSSNGIQV